MSTQMNTVPGILMNLEEEWQMAERDSMQTGDLEDSAYHTGRADALRDLFIQINKALDVRFDFQEFVAKRKASDPEFVAVASEVDGQY
jgi:hypothetical protein